MSAPPAGGHGLLGPRYGDAEVEALASQVAPSYLSFFNALALERVIMAPQAVVMICGPLSSGVVDGVSDRLPGATIQVYEASEAALRAATDHTNSLPVTVDIEVLTALPIKKTDATFTHAMLVHPLSGAALSSQLMREAFRLLVPAGQLLYTLPLRGSYPEIADMLREYALKHDSPKFGEAVEIASQSRPTPETLTDELERLGFVDVAVDVELMSVPFDTGRDFAAHPLFELMVAPGLGALLGEPSATVSAALEYARSAVAKYWSEGQFDLTVNIGCATARKP